MPRFGRFLAELKKRHVYRVAVAYAIAAWAIIQVTSTIVPELGLPSWITPAVIIFSIVGFPLALVLAWAYDLGPDGVERTGATDDVAAPVRRRFASGRVIGAVALVLVVLAGVAAAALSARGRDVPRGDELIAELLRLTTEQSYADAFELAARANAELPDSITSLFTDHLTITTDPAGASVRARRFVPGDSSNLHGAGDWLDLGRTPLRAVAVPRGDYHVRVEADGHAAAERVLSSANTRGAFGNRMPAGIQMDVRLLPADRVPAEMVHVPGGLYRIASRDLQSLSTMLDDFFIDRHEVTNAQFAEFVDEGGYARREFWSDLHEAERAGAGDAMRTFVDRTGMAAPRNWSGQRPAAGTEQHPVAGVSWYEASAYCRYRRKTLPTLFEWEKAARDGVTSRFGVELPWGYVGGPGEPATGRANFGGQGTVPVGSYPFGVSPYGAYDMAGNVKEWLRNRSEDGRAVTGGSWADPIYIFAEVGSVSAAASSPSIGFRCARAAADERGTPAAQGGQPLRLAVETPVYTPVSDAEFRALLTLYQYDAQPLEARVEERLDAPGWIRERITYNGPDGARVIAYLFLPKSAQPPFQTIVSVPSTVAFLGLNLATLAERDLGPLIRGGRAVFTVVMEGMTEREVPGASPPAPSSVAFQDQMVRRGKELRLGLDYLETRDDIDISRLAYMGVSWGAGSRSLYAAIDDRFRAAVFIGGGIDERVQPTLPGASNINFLPRIRGPKLVVNGREDEEHPWLTRGLPLWNLLSEPKELALFDGVGHVPPAELRIPVIRDFLDRHLR